MLSLVKHPLICLWSLPRVVFALLLFIAGANALLGAAIPPRPQVLVLHSSYRGFVWTDTEEQGISAVLAHSGLNPQVYIEFLDLYRNPGAGYAHDIRQLIAGKYAHRHFDVIICTDDPALDFVLDNRASLYPGIPTTFCGINDFQDSKLRGLTGFTGVSETIDVKGTLEVMLALHPHLRHVTVIGDNRPYYYANRAQLYRVMPAYRGRVDFQFIEGVPLEQLGARFAQLPSDSVVLLLSQLWNARGEQLFPGPATQQLTAECPFPIYTCWDFFLDHGVVGGKVISGYSQGATAAEMAVRILRGTPVAAIPIVRTSPTQYVFDYQALQRFGLSRKLLPPGSIYLNRPAAWYKVAKPLLWGGLALLGVLVCSVLELLRVMRVRKRTAAQERKIAVMAERARMQSEFLSCLSHELKTPLTPILAGLESLEEGGPPPELHRRLIVTMHQQAKRLRYLIDDLLSLMLMESGQLALHRETLDLPVLIKRNLAAFQTMNQDAELTCEYQEVTPVPPIFADAHRIEQILDNLINNARRYTATRQAHLTLRTSLRDDVLRLEVQDTGMGIAAHDLERIFECFTQVDPFSPGAGLGLTIVKRLVEAHGGTIWAESPGLGLGSTFVIELPLQSLTSETMQLIGKGNM